VKHVEPAFIVGYTEPFDESAFNEASAKLGGLSSVRRAASQERCWLPGAPLSGPCRWAWGPAAWRFHAPLLGPQGLACFAFSSHIDLGIPEADRIFARRMDFAGALGAKVINTNAARRDRAETFFRNIEVLAAHAERLNMIIALENPGKRRR